MTLNPSDSRVFKTAFFSKLARKAKIKDAELCRAVAEVMDGKAVDLGNGVYKKRLDKNRHRSIILARGQKLWVFEYLNAKKDKANITQGELEAFRALAKAYGDLTAAQLNALIGSRDLLEICHDTEA
jgi:hypothetical protein